MVKGFMTWEAERCRHSGAGMGEGNDTPCYDPVQTEQSNTFCVPYTVYCQ